MRLAKIGSGLIPGLGAISCLGTTAYLNAYRPIRVDPEHGFVVARKLLSGIVFLTPWESSLVDYLWGFAALTFFIGGWLQLKAEGKA